VRLELADRDTNNEGRLRKKAKLFDGWTMPMARCRHGAGM